MKIAFQDLRTGEELNSWDLTASQERFMSSPKRVILFSGGYGCGKSLVLLLKALDLALRYPKNFILMGRKTYVELRDSLIKEFFSICPESLIKNYYKSELKVELVNQSEIVFRHLDKMAATEIRSMNLGAAFIDQAEDISRDVVLGLIGRLRREGIADGDRKLCLSMNPALTWHFADFKQNPKPEYELIEASTLENKDHLPAEYVADLLAYPESYKRQFVYGVWDESLLSTGTVFATEFIEHISRTVKEPLKEVEGLKIYAEFIPGHRYQMGIDVAEASEEQTEKKDKSSITIADLTTYEEVAHWAGQIPPDIVAEKAAHFARRYQGPRTFRCVVLPEMNSIGLALVNKLKQEIDVEIYHREEFDKSVGKRLKKLGWRTTRQSKPLLINHFQELLRKKNPQVRTRATAEEFKTFIYSDEARKSGMGAKIGFHDDRIISLLLAFFEPGEVVGGAVLSPYAKETTIRVHVQPTLIIKNGIAHLRGLEPRLPIKKWTTI